MGIFAQFGVRKLASDDQGGFGNSYKGLASEVILVLVSTSMALCKASHLSPWDRTPQLHNSLYFAARPHSTWALNVVFQSGCLSSTHPNCILSARHFPQIAYDTTMYVVRPELSYMTTFICKEFEEIHFLKVCSSHMQLKSVFLFLRKRSLQNIRD